jgi:ribosomal protein L20A (L18A)
LGAWLTEEYGKEKVLSYFNQSYGVDKSDIRIGWVEKKPFEIDFGLYLSPANKSLPETSVRAEVNFYRDVKHEILSAPWFKEENAKEKVFDYLSQKYGIDKKDIIINSIEKNHYAIGFAISFQPPKNPNPIRKSCCTSIKVWVTVYGKVYDEGFIAIII